MIKKENVDLSNTRRLFFDKLRELLQKNPNVESLMIEQAIDMKVTYRSRAQLPDEVRP